MVDSRNEARRRAVPRMDQDRVEGVLVEAVRTLYAENLDILKLDVAERTICAQLAAILQRSFPDHAVHAEYNRHGVHPKEILLPNAQGALTRNRVYPDLIVHQPGHDEQNVLVIETKKSTNPVGDEGDLAKLVQIKQQIGYSFAVFLRLATGAELDAQNIHLNGV
jgi:hypothetical protein